MITTLRNLTPHAITIHGDAGYEITLPSEGVARCSTESEPMKPLDLGSGRIPLVEVAFGRAIDLPDPEPGVVLVVSGLLLDAEADRAIRAGQRPRRDLAAPGELVRDDQGRPIGCRGLRVRW